MPSSIQASYSLPVGVRHLSILGARSRNLGSIRVVYISGGSIICVLADISLNPDISDVGCSARLTSTRSWVRLSALASNTDRGMSGAASCRGELDRTSNSPRRAEYAGLGGN